MKCVSLTDHPFTPECSKEQLMSILKYDEGKAKLFIEQYVKQLRERTLEAGEQSPKNLDVNVATIGSEDTVYDDLQGNGMYRCIFLAYINHWNLRTSPDDWWFCVVRRIALAMEDNAEKDSVRQMFANNDGKNTVEVHIPSSNIYDVDYNWLLNEISVKMEEKGKLREYLEAVTADFSTTTSVQKIASQITLPLMSVRTTEVARFTSPDSGGIPAVEMLGTEDDWSKLQSKMKEIRTLLEPIENDIGLSVEWWAHVEKVFTKLLDTYKGEPDKTWWSHILSCEPGRAGGNNEVDGWIRQFMVGINNPGYFGSGFATGLVRIPLPITDSIGVKDTASLAAGVISCTVHDDDEVPSIQPFYSWSILLTRNSPLTYSKLMKYCYALCTCCW